MDWIPHKGNSSFQEASTARHLHELLISQQVTEIAILPSGMSHRTQRIYPSTLLPTCPTIWQGKERVLPLRRSQGWKPQEGWTLAAAEDPVEVAREGGWPAGLPRREREDAQPEKKKDQENQRMTKSSRTPLPWRGFQVQGVVLAPVSLLVTNECTDANPTPAIQGNFTAQLHLSCSKP